MLGSSRKKVLDSIFQRLDALESAPPPPPPPVPTLSPDDPELLGIQRKLDLLDGMWESSDRKVKEYAIALSEGIEREERRERRINATVARARKELRESGVEHAGLEAEAGDLRKVDGDGGHGTEVLHLPEPVEEPAEVPSSIRGVPASTLRRVRGY